MNKDFLKLLFKQLFEAELAVKELSEIKDFDSELSSQFHMQQWKRAKAAEAQCVDNIDSYLNLHK